MVDLVHWVRIVEMVVWLGDGEPVFDLAARGLAESLNVEPIDGSLVDAPVAQKMR